MKYIAIAGNSTSGIKDNLREVEEWAAKFLTGHMNCSSVLVCEAKYELVRAAPVLVRRSFLEPQENTGIDY